MVWILVALVDLLGEASSPSVSDEVLATLTTGSFFEVIRHNIFRWFGTLAVLMVIQGPAVFAIFLTGHALGRTDWLNTPERFWNNAKPVLKIIGPLALLGSTLGGVLQLTVDARWHTLGFAVGFLIAPLMAASYLIVLARLFGTKTGRMANLMRSSGRMSLTVYLFESIVATTLSLGYGFGLVGQVAPLGGIAASVVIWLGLAVFAQFWMERFRFGPFEWLLRSITYRKRQTWRRADKTRA